MRGTVTDQPGMFSYVTLEARIPADHPLRPIREMTDAALQAMSRKLSTLYSHTGRPSIPPEHLLRALVVQVLFSVRSERRLMEQLEYNLLFRWFVGPDGRSGLGRDGVHEEPRSIARGRCGCRVPRASDPPGA
jgi:transposase